MKKAKFRGGPRSVMVALLTRMQEVRGSNPGAAPPKVSPNTPIPRLQVAKKSRVSERDGVCESRAPGMTQKPNFEGKL